MKEEIVLQVHIQDIYIMMEKIGMLFTIYMEQYIRIDSLIYKDQEENMELQQYINQQKDYLDGDS